MKKRLGDIEFLKFPRKDWHLAMTPENLLAISHHYRLRQIGRNIVTKGMSTPVP